MIEEINIACDSGMNVFTGETGAGKSIIVGALSLVLGERADSQVIRSGSQQTEITAIFVLDKNVDAIASFLAEQTISYDGELILRRVIQKNGPSRCYINGSIVPVKLLHLLGTQIADIHGQHEHQTLLQKTVQRELLDQFANHVHAIAAVNNAYTTWYETTHELQKSTVTTDNHDAQIELLQYQIQELEALELPDEETFNALKAEHKYLNNAQYLLATCKTVLHNLADTEHAIQNQLNHSLGLLQDMQQFDDSLSSITELLDSANIEIAEAANMLLHYSQRLNIDHEKIIDVSNHLDALHALARKHQVKPEALHGHMLALKDALDNIENSSARQQELLVLQEQSLKQYYAAAEKLSKQRQQAAKNMSERITKKLPQLGLPLGKFAIDIDSNKYNQPLKNGMDYIQYLVSLNRGQPFQALNLVASGGELSRISLAIQVTASKDKGVPILVFDEVDSGIGGSVAEIVGQLLRSLSNNRQVFCVTHLPQIAAQADHHLKISKTTNADTTQTKATKLNAQQCINEIARMLGGVKITPQTLAHAEEMLNNRI